jgi:hypothetical protein
MHHLNDSTANVIIDVFVSLGEVEFNVPGYIGRSRSGNRWYSEKYFIAFMCKAM